MKKLREGFPDREDDTAVASYSGAGTLDVHGAGSVRCRFRADQDADGRIQIVFSSISSIDFVSNLLSVLKGGIAALFRGTTDGGIEIVSKCIGGKALSLDKAGNATVYFLPRGLKTFPKGEEDTACEFLITNFAFSPFTHLGEPPKQPPAHAFVLQSDDHQIEVEIRPLEDYVERIVRIQQTRTILPTAYLVIKASSIMPAPWYHEKADRLCKLISLAAGTVIEWIVADGFDPEVKKRYRFHSAAITKPFCSLPTVPIKDFSHQANATILRDFLQTGLKRFGRGDDRHLNILIAAFLDARLEGEFLETRGIKVAVTLEIVKNEFAEKFINDEWELLLPSALRTRIRVITKSALAAEGVGPDAIKLTEESLSQLSRPSLRRIVNYMLNELRLFEDKKVIDAVISIRNRLVHMGRFISQTDSATASKLDIADEVHEFYLLLSFVDRILLRAFGHSGSYIDYSESNRARIRTAIKGWTS